VNTDITGPISTYYKDYLLNLGKQKSKENSAFRDQIVQKMAPEKGSIRDLLEITSFGKEPDIQNSSLKNITKRIKHANLDIGTKKRLLQHAWNVFKTNRSEDEDFESKFEKVFYELIQTMEFQKKYRINLEKLKKHVKELNEMIRGFIKRDENEKQLKEKIDKLALEQKEVRESAKKEKGDLKDRIKAILENSEEESAGENSNSD